MALTPMLDELFTHAIELEDGTIVDGWMPAGDTNVQECGGKGGKPGPCPEPGTGDTSGGDQPAALPHYEQKRHVVRSLLAGAIDKATAAQAVAARIGQAAWDQLPPKAQRHLTTTYRLGKAIEHRAMAAFRKGRELAVEVARQRGLGEAHAERVGRILGIADQGLAWTVNFPATVAVTGSVTAGKVASFLPVASLAYVAASTARDPFAAMRAAKTVLGRRVVTHEALESLLWEALDDEDAVADLLELLAGAEDPDWAEALLMVAWDQTHDLDAALAAARAALQEHPQMPGGGTSGEMLEAKDSAGHEHKGKGKGGGQFTSGGSGGAGGDTGKDGKKDTTGGKNEGPGANKKGEGKRTAPPKMSAKAARAKAAHHMVDKSIQRYAEEHNEPRFAKAVGGESYPNGEPIDVGIKEDDKLRHGIELKTMVDNKASKITMKRSARQRKDQWEKETGGTFHTVVLDDQKVFNAQGDGQHDESARKIYYRRGHGSFRVSSMHPVKDIKELHRLFRMREEELPPAARRIPFE